MMIQLLIVMISGSTFKQNWYSIPVVDQSWEFSQIVLSNQLKIIDLHHSNIKFTRVVINLGQVVDHSIGLLVTCVYVKCLKINCQELYFYKLKIRIVRKVKKR